MKNQTMHVEHPFPPLWNEESEILILGSFPSVKSREEMFFYGHPRNRFWKVLAAVLGCDEPKSIEEKKEMLLKNHIALWDVIASCDIRGSSDSSIKNAVANNIGFILKNSRIKRIYTNGATADRLYQRYMYPETGIKAVRLPSTSPANAAVSTEELINRYLQELTYKGNNG